MPFPCSHHLSWVPLASTIFLHLHRQMHIHLCSHLMSVLVEELQQAVNQQLLPQPLHMRQSTLVNVLASVGPSSWMAKWKDKSPLLKRASMSERNANSTCSVAGEIWLPGSVSSEDSLVSILALSHLKLVRSLDYISCIDMAQDTLRHMVYSLRLNFIILLPTLTSFNRWTCETCYQIAWLYTILECFRRVGFPEWLVCSTTLKLALSVHIILCRTYKLGEESTTMIIHLSLSACWTYFSSSNGFREATIMQVSLWHAFHMFWLPSLFRRPRNFN